MRDEVEVDSGIGRLLSLTRRLAASGKTRLGRPLHVDAASRTPHSALLRKLGLRPRGICVGIRNETSLFRRGRMPRQRGGDSVDRLQTRQDAASTRESARATAIWPLLSTASPCISRCTPRGDGRRN